MKGKDLLKAFGTIHPKYYEEAELTAVAKPRRVFQKPLLAAAILAMSLLLAGCAVVYVLSMQNLKVGDRAATKPVFETNGIDIAGFEEVNEQILTLAGLKGSNGYRAALEWYEFKQNYDPDHVIQMAAYAQDTRPEFPREFALYNLYSQEMKDKLDGILAKYNLKPAGQYLDFETTKNLCTALGIEKIQTAEKAASVRVKNGGAYENGNFNLNLDFTFPEDGNELTTTWGNLLWNRKDCFSDDTIAIEDTGDWVEWNYTTANGNEVLIMRSESDWRGWIICDRPDATMSLMLEARRDLGNNVDGKTWWDYIYMTDRQMEMCADAVDFGIQPKVATAEDVANQEGFSMEATQDGYTVAVKSFTADGDLAHLVLSIAGPEDVVISRPTRPEDTYFNIMPTNFDIFTLTDPAPEQAVYANYHAMAQDDGDGKDNTTEMHYILMKQGNLAPGKTWTLRLEDLVHSYWDGTNRVDEVLAQGQWQFDIPITEDSGDFRSIQLVKDPIPVQASIGMGMDGSDVMDTVRLLSFTLRAYSAAIETDEYGEIDRGSIRQIFVVMKDGTKVALEGGNGGGTKRLMQTASPIDITQVDHVLLPDDTKLPANP